MALMDQVSQWVASLITILRCALPSIYQNNVIFMEIKTTVVLFHNVVSGILPL